MRRILALAVLSIPATPAVADGLAIDHKGVDCIVAEEYPRLTACFAPASQLAHARVFFRAAGGPHWYFVDMQSDFPCFAGVLPKPKVTTTRVEYYVEGVDRAFAESRTGEYAPEVVADSGVCSKKLLAGFLGKAKVLVNAPPGAPSIPAGFSSAGVSTASTASAASTPSSPSTPTTTAPAAPPSSPAPTPSAAAKSGGGGGGKAAAIVVGVGAAVAAVAIAAGGGGGGAASTSTTQAPVTTTPQATTTTTTTTTTTMPAPPPGINVTGRWAGTEDIRYPSGCLEHDNVTFDLTQSGSSVSGNVAFTVVTCGCCQGTSGNDALTGSVDGTTISLRTPSGFVYNGTISGNNMSGSIVDSGGANGDWGVKKR